MECDSPWSQSSWEETKYSQRGVSSATSAAKKSSDSMDEETSSTAEDCASRSTELLSSEFLEPIPKPQWRGVRMPTAPSRALWVPAALTHVFGTGSRRAVMKTAAREAAASVTSIEDFSPYVPPAAGGKTKEPPPGLTIDPTDLETTGSSLPAETLTGDPLPASLSFSLDDRCGGTEDNSNRLRSEFPWSSYPAVSSVDNPSWNDSFIPILPHHSAVIGVGTYGVVRRMQFKGHVYAVKTIPKKNFEGPQRAVTVKEIEAQSMLCHPHVAQLFQVLEDSESVHLVMEYCSGGNLFNALRRSPHRRFDELTTFRRFIELTSGILAIHGAGFVHRDLKLENILLDSNGTLKITDFGWVTPILGRRRHFNFCGTQDYLPPEMVQGRGHDWRMDIWALGVLLYEMRVGRPPFNSTRHHNLMTLINKAHVAHWPKDISEDFKETVLSMLQYQPRKRLQLEDVFTLSWTQRMLCELHRQALVVAMLQTGEQSSVLKALYSTASLDEDKEGSAHRRRQPWRSFSGNGIPSRNQSRTQTTASDTPSKSRCLSAPLGAMTDRNEVLTDSSPLATSKTSAVSPRDLDTPKSHSSDTAAVTSPRKEDSSPQLIEVPSAKVHHLSEQGSEDSTTAAGTEDHPPSPQPDIPASPHTRLGTAWHLTPGFQPSASSRGVEVPSPRSVAGVLSSDLGWRQGRVTPRVQHKDVSLGLTRAFNSPPASQRESLGAQQASTSRRLTALNLQTLKESPTETPAESARNTSRSQAWAGNPSEAGSTVSKTLRQPTGEMFEASDTESQPYDACEAVKSYPKSVDHEEGNRVEATKWKATASSDGNVKSSDAKYTRCADTTSSFNLTAGCKPALPSNELATLRTSHPRVTPTVTRENLMLYMAAPTVGSVSQFRSSPLGPEGDVPPAVRPSRILQPLQSPRPPAKLQFLPSRSSTATGSSQPHRVSMSSRDANDLARSPPRLQTLTSTARAQRLVPSGGLGGVTPASNYTGKRRLSCVLPPCRKEGSRERTPLESPCVVDSGVQTPNWNDPRSSGFLLSSEASGLGSPDSPNILPTLVQQASFAYSPTRVWGVHGMPVRPAEVLVARQPPYHQASSGRCACAMMTVNPTYRDRATAANTRRAVSVIRAAGASRGADGPPVLVAADFSFRSTGRQMAIPRNNCACAPHDSTPTVSYVPPLNPSVAGANMFYTTGFAVQSPPAAAGCRESAASREGRPAVSYLHSGESLAKSISFNDGGCTYISSGQSFELFDIEAPVTSSCGADKF